MPNIIKKFSINMSKHKEKETEYVMFLTVN